MIVGNPGLVQEQQCYIRPTTPGGYFVKPDQINELSVLENAYLHNLWAKVTPQLTCT